VEQRQSDRRSVETANWGSENRTSEEQRDRSEGGSQNGEQPPREPEFGEGIIEISGKGFGFLRDAKRNFIQTPQDIFVTPRNRPAFSAARRHVDLW
jgi:transcription termination factor Rho